MARRRRNPSVGFIDLCRVDGHGKVRCDDRPKTRARFGKAQYLPTSDDDRVCLEWDPETPYFKENGTVNDAACRRWKDREYSKEVRGKEGCHVNKRGKVVCNDRNVGGSWDAKMGAPFFTSTSKVHAPTFGVPPAGTCPAVQTPVLQWLKDAVKKPELRRPEKMLTRLMQEVPRKCLACYATTGNYVYAETQRAMANRLEWLATTPKEQKVEQLVHAIKHAGNEQCAPGKGCKYVPGVQPEYFRAFDSGDFRNQEDVEMWTEVAKRLPGTKFWFPTTAYGGTCHQTPEKKERFVAALRRLNALPNAVVRPSSRGIDVPAVEVEGLGPGSAVVESTKAAGGSESFEERGGQIYHRGGKTSNRAVICDEKGGSCTSHWICPGNCALCRKCWNKKDPVVYRRHGLRPLAEHIQKLVRKVTGLEEHASSSQRAIFDTANAKIQDEFGKLFNEMYDGPAPPKMTWKKIVRQATPIKAEK